MGRIVLTHSTFIKGLKPLLKDFLNELMQSCDFDIGNALRL